MAGFAHAMVNGLNLRNVTVKTSEGDVTMVNEGAVVVLKDSGAATAVTLRPSPSIGDCVMVIDGKGDAASNNITISGDDSETINGASTYVISENYGGAMFMFNGQEWNVVSAFNLLAAAEMAFLNGVTAGTATASKAVVLGASKEIATITSLTATLGIIGGQRYGDIGTVAAAGSVIANATAITNRVTYVTASDGAKGVVLPTPTAGDEYFIYNTVAAALKIYPHVNGDINDGTANAEITIENKSLAHFVAIDTTTWAAIYTANA